MSAATTYAALRRLGLPILTTGEAAAALRTSQSAASRGLRTLAARGLVRRIRHGLWAITDQPVHPLAIVSELTRPYPAYVSFESALAAHGAIDQIPRDIAVSSLGKPRRVRTSVGTFVIHHLPADLFGGYTERNGVAIARVEKALFDSFYVAAASGHPDRRLPELELPASFSRRALEHWVSRVPSRRLRTLVGASLGRALAHAELESARPQRRESAAAARRTGS